MNDDEKYNKYKKDAYESSIDKKLSVLEKKHNILFMAFQAHTHSPIKEKVSELEEKIDDNWNMIDRHSEKVGDLKKEFW